MRDREQQRGEVGGRGQLRARARAGGQLSAGVVYVERHPDRLLVGAAALRAQPVRAGVLAVIGCEDHDRVGLQIRPRVERVEHAADLRVDLLLVDEIHSQHLRPARIFERAALVGDGAAGHRRRLLQRRLQPRLAGAQLRRGLGIRRRSGEAVIGRFQQFVGRREARPPVDVMRVDQRDRRAPRSDAGAGEPFDELVGDRRVLFLALLGVAVGRRVGAAVEAVGLEPARRLVGLRAQMPLAPPRRLIALFAQHRPPGRELRAERAARSDRFRQHAAGLVRIETCQHRAARGHAHVRRRVVTLERRRAVAESRQVWQQRVELGLLREPLRRAQLVDDDREDVRPALRLRRDGERRERLRGDDAAAGCRGLPDERPAIDSVWHPWAPISPRA